MPISDIDICNLALTKLGAQPIVSLLDVNPRAQALNGCYAIYRDMLQRKRWNFNRAYTTLATNLAQPPFEYTYAYNLPDDYLRLELAGLAQTVGITPPPQPPNTILAAPLTLAIGMPGINLADFNSARSQDYRIVGKQIWINQFPPLAIIYGRRETDPNKFDANFVETFASLLALQNCERITSSGQKKQMLAQEYRESITNALQAKAIENAPEIIPDDTFVLARIST